MKKLFLIAVLCISCGLQASSKLSSEHQQELAELKRDRNVLAGMTALPGAALLLTLKFGSGQTLILAPIWVAGVKMFVDEARNVQKKINDLQSNK